MNTLTNTVVSTTAQHNPASNTVELNNNKSAIIFDDDKFYCLLFRQNVGKILNCDYATNERSFFKKIACHRYDFAFIDYNLHDTNALQIATRMKDYFDLPVVIISSSLNNLYSCDVIGEIHLANIFGTISKWGNPNFIVRKAIEYVSGHEPLSPGLL